MRIYTPDAVRNAEKYMIDVLGTSSLGLMKKAAAGMHTAICDNLVDISTICVLCGKGNNAGDGYELARLLHNNGYNVSCVKVFGDAPCTDIAKICHDEYVDCGGAYTDDVDKALREIVSADVIIDAVFGIGFNGHIENDSFIYRVFDVANNVCAKRIALDVPSGVNSCDGSIGGIAFKADITLTVNVIKSGMLSYPAKKYCGSIQTVNIGIPESVIEKFENNYCFVPDNEYVKSALPERAVDSNKGDFGKVLCICGSEDMTGAAVMSVGAALRSGAGIVTLASVECVSDIVKCRYPEPIYKKLEFDDASCTAAFLNDIKNYSAVLVGCGLGKSENKRLFIENIIRSYKGTLIIDADGINLISHNINILKEAECTVILTPHPAEFSRISGINVPFVNENRIKCAKDFSKAYRCITVLKGAGTVITDGDKTAVNTSGNPGLAKGGSGDVLAGLIAGLAANKSVSPFDAATCGVFLHGKAADVLKAKYSEYGLLPSDLAEEFAKMLP